MSSGSCASIAELSEAALSIVLEARRAVLASVDRRGRPHAVPTCFAMRRTELVSAIDQKPKGDTELQRVANLRANPAATLLFDRWSEEWTHLGWVMVRGNVRFEPPGSADGELIERYPQYAADPPRGDVIVIAPKRVLWWLWD